MSIASRVWNASRLLVAMLAVPGLGLAADRDSDDASARRQAMYEWYTDDYSHHGEPGFTNQKPMYFGPEYERFLNAVAKQQRQKYGALLPGSGMSASLINAPQSAFVTGNWLNIGPNNANFAQNGGTLNVTDSGRVNVIIVDPNDTNTIYVGFSGGGVWKSTDGGSNWTPKTEMLGSLSVGTLEMDPSDSNTLYLGLGDPFDGTGIGLVKSTDGGDTWSDVVYLGDSSIIADIEVSHSNPQIVLAGTNTGLYRSTDGGASFSKISIATGQAADPFVWTLAWGGGDTYVLGLEAAFANLGTGSSTLGQIWRSTDAGVTWTQSTGVTDANGVGRLYIAAAASNRNVMYAEAANQNAGINGTDLANIFKSTDNGVTWTGTARGKGKGYKTYTNSNTESKTLDTLFNGQGWYDQLVLVDPTNPNVAYFGGALLAAKTTDGGSTYSEASNWLAQFSLPYVHADFHGGTIAANGAVYFGTDGGIFRSTDSGATFTDTLNKGIASMLVYQVGSSKNNTNSAIVGLQDNGTRVRVGNTGTFNQIIGGDGFGCNINEANATQMLGSLYYDRVYKSTDSGVTFSAACSGIAECNNSTNAPFHTMLSRWDGDATGNTLFTFSNFKAYKTTNYAGAWTALGTTGLPASGSIFIRGIGSAKSSVNTVGIVANGGRAYLTTNGTSWTQIGSTTNIPGNGLSMSWISFDPTNASIIYLASVAPSLTANHLWRSTDSGTTWAPIDSAASGFPFGIPVNALVVDPATPTTLYAATHLGVYASQDSGVSWTRWGSGMPLVNVTDLYVANDDSLIRAASYGRSVWELSPVPTYTIGGSVNGLTSSGLVLAEAAGNETKIVASGATSYVFPFAEADGTHYSVSVKTQPAGQTCSVSNATGIIAGANVINANVTCTTNTYTVTPSVSGGHGTIDPNAAQIVNYQDTPSFTLAADAGYHIVTPVGGTCGGALVGNVYTTNAVTTDCTVVASFAPNPPDHLVIAGLADGTAGVALSPFTVTVVDAGNNTVTGDLNGVTLSITAGPGSTFDAASTVTVSFTNGVATFSNVVIDKAGSGYKLKATDGGDTLNVTSSAFTIAPAAAATLKFTSTVSDITQGATLGNVTVTEFDAFNNSVTTDSTTQVTLTAGSCGGTQLGNGTLSGGAITFPTTLAFKTVASSVSLSAAASPATPTNASATFNVTANSAWIFDGEFDDCTP